MTSYFSISNLVGPMLWCKTAEVKRIESLNVKLRM